MPIDLENIPGEEFIRLCNELESKPNIDEKMKFYISVRGFYEIDDFLYKSREIDGTNYKFGITDSGVFNQLTNWAFENLVPKFFDRLFNDYLKRKDKCEAHELKEFMDRELADARVNSIWVPYQRGFDAELSKRTPAVEEDFEYTKQVGALCNGMAMGRFYSAIRKELSMMNPTVKESPFKLSKKRGTKTDIIKILYAVNRLQLIVNKNDETVPSLDKFFTDFGNFLGEDLTTWSTVINQFKSTENATNRKVFDEMAKTVLEVANRDIK